MVTRRFWVETLGCPKNAVDSDKITGSLLADGLVAADRPEDADVVVVNTCAFIEPAREESIEVLLELGGRRKDGAQLVATGCMAERYGAELAAALPEADAVVGFGDAGNGAIGRVGLDPATQPVTLRRAPRGVRDLLDLPRPAPRAPWAYLKVADGCDRACAFCAIPTFRGKQVSRTPESVLAEAHGLVGHGVVELVLVAQDLAWYGRDAGETGALVSLLHDLDALRADGLERLRLLYLYPSEVRAPLVDAMLDLPSVVPYFDLSLQHASRPLLARMKRWGSGEQFLAIVEQLRAARPDAAFRSSFISGFPGETDAMHDELLDFVATAQLDWAGFFSYSREDGTSAASLDGDVDPEIVRARVAELSDVQERITRSARAELIGTVIDVIVDGTDDDGALIARSHREAPEIDGVVRITGADARPGAQIQVEVVDCDGTDLVGAPVRQRRAG